LFSLFLSLPLAFGETRSWLLGFQFEEPGQTTATLANESADIESRDVSFGQWNDRIGSKRCFCYNAATHKVSESPTHPLRCWVKTKNNV